MMKNSEKYSWKWLENKRNGISKLKFYKKGPEEMKYFDVFVGCGNFVERGVISWTRCIYQLGLSHRYENERNLNFTSEVETFSFYPDYICKNLISMTLFVKGGSYSNIFVNFVVVLIILLKISNQCESGDATTLQQPGLKDLPGPNASWTKIRMSNYVYVDKTHHLIEMLTKKPHQNHFICRPRGFGKSTFVQMVAEFFRGKESLFYDLEIGKLGNNYFRKKLWPHSSPFNFANDSRWIEFPVVALDFSTMKFSTEKEFDELCYYELNLIARRYNIIKCIPQPPTLRTIVAELNIQYNLPVIVLIDEYDAPFQHALVILKNKKVAAHVKNELQGLFQLIKASSKEIGFALVVGISKIPQSDLDCGGNNFYDMTYDNIMAHAFGLTEEELRKYMKHHLKAFAEACNFQDSGNNTAEGRVIRKIKVNYDGYNFDLKNNSAIRVMNPISTIQSLKNQDFDSYWHLTKSNSYLGRAFAKIGAVFDTFDPSYTTSDSELFPGYPIDPITEDVPLPVFLLSYGYVTISHYNRRTEKITLKYPNKEIRDAVTNELAEYQPLKGKSIQELTEETNRLFLAMNCGSFQKVIDTLRTFEFTPFLHPSIENVTSQEITRRFNRILVRCGIRFEEGVVIMKDWKAKHQGGDIDFLTTSLQLNYAISVKCGEGGGAFEAVIQLIEYIYKFPKGYTNALKARNLDGRNIYLMGLGFSYHKGGYLQDWVVVPYRNGAFQYNFIQADSEELRMQTVQEMDNIKSELLVSRLPP